MARLVFLLLTVVFLNQSEALIDRTIGCTVSIGQERCKPCLRPGSEPGKETYNKSPDVTELELDKSDVHLPPAGQKDPRGIFVEVTTTAEDPEGDVLTYNYTISGGRVVGTGKKVSWSLDGVQPGTYTITAGVDDGCGVCGKTVTQTVT